MIEINDGDGGPAFPIAMHYDFENYAGMSLRDWFAGQALSGMMAHKDSSQWTSHEVANDCYLHANAMLAARKGKSK